MIELKRHVERIVRPIRASESRKYRMRKELFAHLMAAAEEVGVDRAIERLGSVEDVRRELQSSVPRIERLMQKQTPVRIDTYANKLFDPANAPLTKYALLASLQAVAFLLVLVVSVSVIAFFVLLGSGHSLHIPARPDRALTDALLCGSFLLWAGVLIFGMLYLCSRTPIRTVCHESSSVSSWIKAAIELTLIAATSAVGLAGGLVLSVILSDETRIARETLESLGTVFGSLPPSVRVGGFILLYASTTYHDYMMRLRYLEWGHIEIDERVEAGS